MVYNEAGVRDLVVLSFVSGQLRGDGACINEVMDGMKQFPVRYIIYPHCHHAKRIWVSRSKSRKYYSYLPLSPPYLLSTANSAGLAPFSRLVGWPPISCGLSLPSISNLSPSRPISYGALGSSDPPNSFPLGVAFWAASCRSRSLVRLWVR